MPIITADEARGRVGENVDENLISIFNDKLEWALRNRERSFNLDFEIFGYDYDDVAFVKRAGYQLNRNGACLWWEVSFKDD